MGTKNLILYSSLTLHQVFGHQDVSVLDGGLPRWKFRGYPVHHGPPATVTPQEYNAKFNDRLIRTFEQMVENFNNKNEQVLIQVYLNFTLDMYGMLNC